MCGGPSIRGVDLNFLFYNLNSFNVFERYVHVVTPQGGNDPQTEADRKAQRCIVSTIATRFPDVRLHGEEVLIASYIMLFDN